MIIDKHLQEFLKPGLRLFLICAAAALALSLVNTITAPHIEERKQEEAQKALAQILPAGKSLSERFSAFPIELTEENLNSQILDQLKTEKRQIVSDSYESDGEELFRIKTGLTDEALAGLSETLQGIGYKPKGPVQGYYRVQSGGESTGYVLELAGNGYGGELKVFVAYDTDGTIENAVLVENSESPGKPKKAEEPAYMNKFIGTKGMGVPVIKSMLSPADADAVTGASITFMGVSGAIRAGSLFIMILGGLK